MLLLCAPVFCSEVLLFLRVSLRVSAVLTQAVEPDTPVFCSEVLLFLRVSAVLITGS